MLADARMKAGVMTTTYHRASRTRNAAASREALLASARTLFSSAGFDKTTVRDIGEQAGVDPALIARYFGSKVNLYLATVTAEDADPGARMLDTCPARRDGSRASRIGAGRAGDAGARTFGHHAGNSRGRARTSPAASWTVAAMLAARRCADPPRLRAETAVAALIGVLVVRGTGDSGRSVRRPRTTSPRC